MWQSRAYKTPVVGPVKECARQVAYLSDSGRFTWHTSQRQEIPSYRAPVYNSLSRTPALHEHNCDRRHESTFPREAAHYPQRSKREPDNNNAQHLPWMPQQVAAFATGKVTAPLGRDRSVKLRALVVWGVITGHASQRLVVPNFTRAREEPHCRTRLLQAS